MAEQSSSVVAFRALIILICLVLVPVAAFCGVRIRRGQSDPKRSLPALADFHNPSGPASQATEAPRFLPRDTMPFSPNPASSDRELAARAASPSNVAIAGGTYKLHAAIGTPVLPDSGRSTSFPQNKMPAALLRNFFAFPGKKIFFLRTGLVCRPF